MRFAARPPLALTLLVGSILTACQPAADNDNIIPNSTAVANCSQSANPHRQESKAVMIDGADRLAFKAAQTAAQSIDLSMTDFRAQYCGYERPSKEAQDRCFIFLLTPSALGGEVGVCISASGEIQNIDQGQ